MDKRQLAELITKNTQISTKDSSAVVSAFIEVVKDQLINSQEMSILEIEMKGKTKQ